MVGNFIASATTSSSEKPSYIINFSVISIIFTFISTFFFLLADFLFDFICFFVQMDEKNQKIFCTNGREEPKDFVYFEVELTDKSHV